MITVILICLLFAWIVLGLHLTGFELQKVARGRKYKSGTGWCFWRWTDVDSEYILRLHVLKTPWCAVCLHWIKKPDAEPWLHDHPVSFFSIILRGGYTELRKIGDGAPFHKVNRWFNFVRASDRDRHRIILTRSNTLTLCFMGPKTRDWGFHVWKELCNPLSATFGWIMWKDYYARLRAGEDMRQQNVLGDLVHVVTHVMDDDRITKATGVPNRRDGYTFADVDGRLVDGAPPADFEAEEITKPYGADSFGKGTFGEKSEVDFVVSREDFYKKVKL